MKNNHILNELDFRGAGDLDMNFVLSGWFKTFKFSPWAGCIPNNRFFAVQKDTFDQLIDRGMLIILAVNRTNPDQLLGFTAFERPECGVPVIHFTFVKEEFRRYGVATALHEIAGVDKRRGGHFYFTHRTHDSSFFPAAKWVPLLARRHSLEPVFEWITDEHPESSDDLPGDQAD